ncbi:MAG: hypothetical protein IVW55_15580 [Chloroflexi bacterium]|nr:hypothetical protein [Chloroflexota bacterium]
MQSNYGKRLAYASAPHWAEENAPRKLIKRTVPSLLLINLPEEEVFVVATRDESDAIADPNSFMGRLLRSHCALLALPYLSAN